MLEINYPNLYIESLLKEIKKINEKMSNLNNRILEEKFHSMGRSEHLFKYHSQLESLSLEIEQLNQEIIKISYYLSNKEIER